MDENQVRNVALATLKQRCEYLQQRLNIVEEENCRLKLEKAQDLNIKNFKDSNSLEERIMILNEEKSQMAHQIQMITTENYTLWSQLSDFLPGSNISSFRFSVSTSADQLPKFRKSDSASKGSLCDHDKESLEEISLRLINGIILGKKELEKHYSQMINLQKEDAPEGKSSSFTLKQFDNRAIVKNLKNYVQKLKDFRKVLYEQKNELSNTITLIRSSKVFLGKNISDTRKISNYDHINYCEESDINTNVIDSEFSTLQDIGRDEKSGHTAVCPLCGESISGAFEILYRHVSQHFNEENDEFFDANSAFDVIQ